MLVGFIGSPCSGKTTAAAKLFAELKDMGLSADFISEMARLHIGKKRFMQKAKSLGSTVTLDDEDQKEIFKNQFQAEAHMADDNAIVITDASALNTLMYMSDDLRESGFVKSVVENLIPRYDLLFVCSPVQRPDGIDPNRIHDAKASEEIHKKIETIILPLIEGKTVVQLVGPSRTRQQTAMSAVLECYNARYEK